MDIGPELSEVNYIWSPVFWDVVLICIILLQVVYEVPDMEDLGLVSLRTIVRGAVRIEKNPQLCYVDTIDWTALTSVDHEDDFVLQNKVCWVVIFRHLVVV